MPSTDPEKSFVLRIYGDSISLPRVHQGLPLLETYPELLLRHCRATHPNSSLVNRAEAGKTIVDHAIHCRDDNDWFGIGANDILVIQCGVVDCAPRPLPPRLRRRLERKPAWIRKPIISFLHRNRPLLLRLGFSFQKVGPIVFQNQLREWLKKSGNNFNRVAVLTIPPVTDKAEAHSPGWRANIDLYNNLIRETVATFPNVRLVDVFADLSGNRSNLDQFIDPEDGHHLQSAGHRLVFERIHAALAL